jgi:hypothetical protein
MKKEIREQIDYHINKIMELGKGECNVTVDVFFTDSSTKIITYIEESRDTPVKEPKADPIVKNCDNCKYKDLNEGEEPCNDCHDEEGKDKWQPIEGIEPMKEEQPPYFFTTYVMEHKPILINFGGYTLDEMIEGLTGISKIKHE